jgi:hypothetical protein
MRKLSPEEVLCCMEEGHKYTLYNKDNMICYTDIFERYNYDRLGVSADFVSVFEWIWLNTAAELNADFTKLGYYFTTED